MKHAQREVTVTVTVNYSFLLEFICRFPYLAQGLYVWACLKTPRESSCRLTVWGVMLLLRNKKSKIH